MSETNEQIIERLTRERDELKSLIEQSLASVAFEGSRAFVNLHKQVVEERDALQSALSKAQEFKAYVHTRLDQAGIPTDPESLHKAEGCRVGGRLDIALAAQSELSRVKAELEEAKVQAFERGKSAQAILELRGRDKFIADKKAELCKISDSLRTQLAAEQASRAKMREALESAASAFDELDGVKWYEDSVHIPSLYRTAQSDVLSALSTSPADALREREEAAWKEGAWEYIRLDSNYIPGQDPEWQKGVDERWLASDTCELTSEGGACSR